jgi:hypothetical protein
LPFCIQKERKKNVRYFYFIALFTQSFLTLLNMSMELYHSKFISTYHLRVKTYLTLSMLLLGITLKLYWCKQISAE